MVDVEKVTSNLKKSEFLRLELENHLAKSKKDIGEYCKKRTNAKCSSFTDLSFVFFRCIARIA